VKLALNFMKIFQRN